MTDLDHSSVLALVAALPEWFDEHARTKAIPVDLSYQQGFVAESDEKIVGFITLYVAEGRLNIGWIAVDRDYQRRGIGGRLLAQAEQVARDMAIQELATCTLGDGVDYQPYESTRAFYLKHGFEVYQRNRTDNPSCPEEIKILKRVGQPGAPADTDKPSRRAPR